jgi:hypothetical protein
MRIAKVVHLKEARKFYDKVLFEYQKFIPYPQTFGPPWEAALGGPPTPGQDLLIWRMGRD